MQAARTGEKDGAAANAVAWRISVYYGVIFGHVGVVMPFFPVWLESRGLDAAQIGILLSCMMWVRVFTNPLATSFADGLGRRRPLMTAFAAGGTLTALLYPLGYGFWPLLAVAMLHTVMQAPVMPLGDNIVLLTARTRGLDYGRLRLWGSVTFILTSAGAGALLSGRSEDVILVLMIGLLAATCLSTLLLPDVPGAGAARHKRPIRALLWNPLFLLFVLASALNSAGHAVLNGFATIHWRAAGLSDQTVGVLWAAGVVAEIALFAAGARLTNRVGSVGLFAVGGVAGLVRWIGTGLTTDVWALLALQSLHALTFGASHLGAMAFISRAIPPHLSATAQGLYSSLSMGLIVGLTMMASGALYQALGGGAFHVMALLSLASLAASAALARLWRPGQTIA